MHQDDLKTCHGWAYVPCGRPAAWVGVEIHQHSGWIAYPFCNEHAALWLGPTDDWTMKPESRTLIEAWVAQRLWT